MVGLKKYKIDIFNLPAGKYDYVFDFNPDFFKLFENSLVEKGEGSVQVNLNKSETFLDLNFDIRGSLELTCDRSLELFDFPVLIKKNLIIKFGEEPERLEDDEIVYVPWESQSINVGQYIYEFLSLEIPMKKLHPRYEKNEDDTGKGDFLVFSSAPQNEESEEIDPRWKKLKDLKELNNDKTN